MKIGGRTNRLINAVGAAMILMIALFGVLRSRFGAERFPNTIKAALTLALLIFWIAAVNRRVISALVRRSLVMIAGLELFWVLVRLAKYELVKNVGAERVFWYLYYLPITMIPALCLILSVSMGKPDGFRPRKFLWAFPAFSALLFVFVMTNDLHGLVFDIPPGYEGLAVGNYSYGAGYFVVMTYAGLCAAASFGIIFTKCRVPASRRIRLLPLLPLVVGTAGTVSYAFGAELFFGFYKVDITLFNCIIICVTLEMCIQCRLIPTNSGYDELFRMSGIRAVITDEELSPIICSNSYEKIDELEKARQSPVILENGSRLSCAPIKHGYVLWQDDISELNAVLSELSDTNDYLSGKSAAIREANKYRKKERRLIEKNRLYNRILTQTKPEIELYAQLVEQLARETEPTRERLLAVRMAFVSGFIKRRDNLVFLSEEGKPIDPSELSYCVEELLCALRLCGTECFCSNMLTKPLSFEKISALYENFYKIIYPTVGSLRAVCVYLEETSAGASAAVRITFSEDAAPELGAELEKNGAVSEGGEWMVRICG